MKLTISIFVAVALLTGVMAFSQIKPCEDLKSEIDKKLQDKGVVNYTLEIVPTADIKDQKVIGSCDGGKNKITYTREAAPATEKKEPKKATEEKKK
jgi:hypothetical protein